MVVLEANHPGILPPAASFLSLTGEGLFPMALKPAQDGRGLIFRLRRAGGDGTGVLRFAGRTYSLRVRENGLCTLRLFDGKAEECDLLEGMCRGTDGAEM